MRFARCCRGFLLYWLFLRTAGSLGIYELPEAGSDTPQTAPERHLDLFFNSPGVSYRASSHPRRANWEGIDEGEHSGRNQFGLYSPTLRSSYWPLPLSENTVTPPPIWV